MQKREGMKDSLTDEELIELGRAIFTESLTDITNVYLQGYLGYRIYMAIETVLSTRFRKEEKTD